MHTHTHTPDRLLLGMLHPSREFSRDVDLNSFHFPRIQDTINHSHTPCSVSSEISKREKHSFRHCNAFLPHSISHLWPETIKEGLKCIRLTTKPINKSGYSIFPYGGIMFMQTSERLADFGLAVEDIIVFSRRFCEKQPARHIPQRSPAYTTMLVR